MEAFQLVLAPQVFQQRQAYAEHLQTQFNLQFCKQPSAAQYLHLDIDALRLVELGQAPQHGVLVDFAADALLYRKEHGGGRNEPLAKAIGIKGQEQLSVLDATAGLGRDSFIMASVGALVTMNERHPVVAALLTDGLQRLALNTQMTWLAERLSLVYAGLGTDQLPAKSVDVVYLDPMFPHKKKSAQVKKPMRMFQTLVGADEDADSLLAQAQVLARKRVVVKRPNYAPFLNECAPSMQIKSKKHRFDVYLNF